MMIDLQLQKENLMSKNFFNRLDLTFLCMRKMKVKKWNVLHVEENSTKNHILNMLKYVKRYSLQKEKHLILKKKNY